MGLQAAKIVEEEIERIMPRLQDGPIQVDGRTLADILTSLRARLTARIEEECIEMDEAATNAAIQHPTNCGCWYHAEEGRPCPHEAGQQ